MTAPRVLVAAGLDPTGGAGLVADVEALVAVGARAMAVATALTLQGPRGAAGWEVVPPRFLARQVEELLRGRGERPRALKTGMLGGASTAAHLARLFSRRGLAGLPLVVDPVLAASSGLSLLGHGHRRSPAVVLAPLLARATLVTPNLPELALLAGAPGGKGAELRGDDDAVEAARRLPCEAVLVKGGHREGAPVDLLVRGKSVVRFTGRRRPGTARGTGCRLASAIAGLLAAGAPLEEAVRGAKRVVERYLDAR
ncbi:MAG: hydroxymethylpyrimidine/phosphomethylpyrimidine kinase [Anaeromyxobacteraceae bacterium]